MLAFDADVVIYAAVLGHPLGRRVRALFTAGAPAAPVGTGSVLLIPEILTTPFRENAQTDLVALSALLGRLDLRPVDPATARLAVALGAVYRLKAADAVHLATAVGTGADAFLTNNRRDFTQAIAEIAVTYPDALPEPAA